MSSSTSLCLPRPSGPISIASVKNWWWFIIKGILFIIAGVAVLSRPVEGYVGLSILFSIVILGIGISELAFSISNRKWLQ